MNWILCVFIAARIYRSSGDGARVDVSIIVGKKIIVGCSV